MVLFLYLYLFSALNICISKCTIFRFNSKLCVT